MVISCSRRTDIPAFHSEWLMNRLRAGWALVENPYDAGRLSRVSLTPEQAELIVLWSKDPSPMLKHLDTLDAVGYAYYFQFTVTGYDPDIERGLPPLERRIETFRRLSERLGPDRVDWRFDPVLLSGEITPARTAERFEYLARRLAGHTKRCIFSFIDSYRHIARSVREMSPDEMREVAGLLSEAARAHNLPLFTCCEPVDLSGMGIGHAACIDPDKVARLLNSPVRARKDAGQRPDCGCMESVDIGAYGTCAHGCGYCYARGSGRMGSCDPAAPALTGYPSGRAKITERNMPPVRIRQTSLFQEDEI